MLAKSSEWCDPKFDQNICSSTTAINCQGPCGKAIQASRTVTSQQRQRFWTTSGKADRHFQIWYLQGEDSDSELPWKIIRKSWFHKIDEEVQNICWKKHVTVYSKTTTIILMIPKIWAAGGHRVCTKISSKYSICRAKSSSPKGHDLITFDSLGTVSVRNIFHRLSCVTPPIQESTDD